MGLALSEKQIPQVVEKIEKPQEQMEGLESSVVLRSYAIQKSKCRFWCRLRGSAPFISPLKWTEVGLNSDIFVG
jgi:hypothetical protein